MVAYKAADESAILADEPSQRPVLCDLQLALVVKHLRIQPTYLEEAGVAIVAIHKYLLADSLATVVFGMVKDDPEQNPVK